MQKALSIIGRHDPLLLSQIHGASIHEIVRLENAVGRRLPIAYRAFLEAMGKNLGGLQRPNLDFSIHCVTQVYEVGDFEIPSQYIFIATDGADPYANFFLDESMSRENPSVVRFESDSDFLKEERIDCHAHLEEMVLGWYLLDFRLPKFPYKRTFFWTGERDWSSVTQDKPLEVFEHLALDLGFKLLTSNTSWAPSFERSDALLLGYQAGGKGGFTVTLAIENVEKFWKVVDC